MKIVIDVNGYLHLERAGDMNLQICPFDNRVAVSPCGHWCPMFTEPEDTGDYTLLRLCNTNLLCTNEDFSDLRSTT